MLTKELQSHLCTWLSLCVIAIVVAIVLMPMQAGRLALSGKQMSVVGPVGSACPMVSKRARMQKHLLYIKKRMDFFSLHLMKIKTKNRSSSSFNALELNSSYTPYHTTPHHSTPRCTTASSLWIIVIDRWMDRLQALLIYLEGPFEDDFFFFEMWVIHNNRNNTKQLIYY